MTPGLLPGRPRQTLAGPTALLEGIGLHSGATAAVRVLPASTRSGRHFHDLVSGQEIPALAVNGEESARCTVLRAAGIAVQTVEHLLSALAALGVDDCVIETRGGEIPAMDGSAAPFVRWLLDAGVCVQPDGSSVQAVSLSVPCSVAGETGTLLAALPASHFRASVVLDYQTYPWVGTQAVVFDAATDDYTAAAASARTFGFVHELDWLRARGLALGASYDNALALGEDGYVGVPRFPDELARHKLLDLIGDLALIGAPLQAHVIAVRPSHAANVRLARLLCRQP